MTEANSIIGLIREKYKVFKFAIFLKCEAFLVTKPSTLEALFTVCFIYCYLLFYCYIVIWLYLLYLFICYIILFINNFTK